MNHQDRWLLPAGITDALPEEAAHLEHLRRTLLDLYTTWGYELIIPPMIEYLDSLLVGAGHDLDLQTFKLIDQLNGRLMGIRADMTPQAARIDAHRLKREIPSRLCYLGTVLHTRPTGFTGTRSLLQVGVELYGHAGIESDAEILSLLLTTLKTTGVQAFHVDVGHVGIYRALVEQAHLNSEQESQLFAAIQRKSRTEIHDLLTIWQVSPLLQQQLTALIELNGDVSILAEARQALAPAPAEVLEALNSLEQLNKHLSNFTLHFDLAELRGYNYYTGLVFAAYVPEHGQAIALGGRYDNIGKAFGNARPATGFSTDLRILAELTTIPPIRKTAIFAPAGLDAALQTHIQQLRQVGENVIQALPNQQGDALAMGCNRELCWQAGQWQVRNID
ncbi:ATP phosphoribosyltransferase regulatory subunit [Beggiatoa leptomitoformis]|uniref:ATP phosphoribosyltransferase regulatory subunit n=1 Tax=Beggiatoa leptomitoformis TaxID=288004 RepID=A0A2N9YHT9_9GAMM|nr:ATP phosphoribosyltransferase regulatory subunit [Beggiatoa leptomitoformis]ALG67691.1 ATP phosphoribosyltransferase regulatory subunit [Beggiatoa leptomitoformis]AUI70070.1 ATP phosphoribosyltransferase regulatory subunit [Beggiatoa leptomitoformis]